MIKPLMTAKIKGRMTPWERAAGRFLRSPDGHPEAVVGAAPDAPPAAVTPEVVTPPADAPVVEVLGSILGGASGLIDDSPADGADDFVVDPNAAPADAVDAAGAAEGGEPAEPDATPFEGLKAPEGFAALDEAALNEATPILRELGADTPEKAQAIIDKFGPVLAGMTERANAAAITRIDDDRAARVAEWAAQVQADPEIGGANYAKSVQLAGTVMDRFMDADSRAFLDESGLGNYPGLVKAFAKIGGQISDGTIHTSEAAQPAKGHKMYDDVFLPPEQRRG